MTSKLTNEFSNFIDALVDELIAMPDEQVLEGIDPVAVPVDGLRLLQAAKSEVKFKDGCIAAYKVIEGKK